ncbi:hypothetical protein Clacol_004864 [Clathrus columnatus]|uniref:HAT C-terminal dimerisation domain-containing protein n=1 Tax=Clathrus columnatus TaxID=1419009 RepID=A0AAV5A7P3_9AGAM|nr:hypothetical protein Clacol_004864 [Clathrus columnatus]
MYTTLVGFMKPKSTSSLPPVKAEWSSYCHAVNWPDIHKLNLIEWWDHNRDIYPTLFLLALDYLPGQATSVPSEHVFSSSAETDTC